MTTTQFALLVFLSVPWTYIIVRMASRAVIRTLDERKCDHVKEE